MIPVELQQLNAQYLPLVIPLFVTQDVVMETNAEPNNIAKKLHNKARFII